MVKSRKAEVPKWLSQLTDNGGNPVSLPTKLVPHFNEILDGDTGFRLDDYKIRELCRLYNEGTMNLKEGRN